MSPRDTSTGSVLEQMVLPALNRGGYQWRAQVRIGTRPGGGRHVVDAVAERDGHRWLISMKWQQVSGTAEQKVPFEIICLAEAVLSGGYMGAYLVLGGPGWSLREFYVGNELRRYLANTDKVRVVNLEDFVATANQGKL
jgi:PD-(D/E)XK nuclease superfamily protein